MKWSWRLARLAGIDIYVHATFFILLAWIGISYWYLEGTLSAVVGGVGFILLLFGCVVLHELGHALTARRYGIRTQHITLLPIGGVAALERMPDDPKQEIAVALAGPAVNLVIALGLSLWLIVSDGLAPVDQWSLSEGTFLQQMMLVNVVLAVFNLLPAFPMDGGRVLRAALAMRIDHDRATYLAAKIGQGLAICLGFVGLFYNPFLILIALFIWIGAAAEAGSEYIRSTLSGVLAGQAVLTDFQTLSPDDPLSRAIALTLESNQKEFPVLTGSVFVGVLGQADLLIGLQRAGDTARTGDWMQGEIHSADADEPLENVLKRLESSDYPVVSVTNAGRLVGIINLDNIMELIKIQTALQQRKQI